jgi:hypothetical protein
MANSAHGSELAEFLRQDIAIENVDSLRQWIGASFSQARSRELVRIRYIFAARRNLPYQQEYTTCQISQ